jgi:glycerophosphoryl diester phosphodiesterase
MTPLLLGHRGARASLQIAENTLASFELCLRHGCEGFEFDVRLSADGRPVVCHDASIGGLEIKNAASTILSIPALEDVLREFAHRAFLDIELKVAGSEAQTLTQLSKYPPQKGYVVSSFLPEVVMAIHQLDSTIPLGLVCNSAEQLRGWREIPVEWVIPHFELADRELVKLVHAAGKRIMVWTVDSAERMRDFADLAVDAIISGETEHLVRLRM